MMNDMLKVINKNTKKAIINLGKSCVEVVENWNKAAKIMEKQLKNLNS